MTSPPLIGLPGRRKSGAQVAGFAWPMDRFEIDVYLAAYTKAVLAGGGLPVYIPMDGDPTAFVPHLHGLILPGGCDVEPGRYGQEPDGHGTYEPERDEVELSILAGALDADLPVLGICRGLQVLNVQLGGTLHQHVPPHSRYDVEVFTRMHGVDFSAESRLGLLYGQRIEVNTLHHQTVDQLGDGLVVTAWADDGTIEGMEMPGRDVLAVQWHPELHLEPEPVFDWLIGRAKSRSC